MITFEDIQKANEQIKTTTIEKKNNKTGKVTSKEYAEVNQRIKAFRMVYPGGTIKTDMVSNENGVCIFRAEVYSEPDMVEGFPQRLLATGTAYEKEGSSFINSTSYIENCETSAIGRALGIAGFGIDTSVASFEEVSNAMQNQAANEKISTIKAETLLTTLSERGIRADFILQKYKVSSIPDLTEKQLSNIITNLDKIKKAQEEGNE